MRHVYENSVPAFWFMNMKWLHLYLDCVLVYTKKDFNWKSSSKVLSQRVGYAAEITTWPSGMWLMWILPKYIIIILWTATVVVGINNNVYQPFYFVRHFTGGEKKKHSTREIVRHYYAFFIFISVEKNVLIVNTNDSNKIKPTSCENYWLISVIKFIVFYIWRNAHII